MKVLKPQKLGLISRCFEHERRYYLSIGVLALHHFAGALVSEAELWKFLALELGKFAPDAAMPKSRAEFLVTGRAFQPGGEPRPSGKVRVRIGNLEKTLYVVGNRYWLSSTDSSKPEPFVDMPISWETAFGGEGFDRNPLGKGFGPVQTARGSVHPLPNVELPGSLVASSEDRTEPAGFGPLDMMWPQRFSKAGTHDDEWLKERFPGFSKDMDWSIFNIAPEDQQRREPFRGDEPFLIEGMHPERQTIEGALPGIAARCFVNQRVTGGEEVREVAMRLTTVWFFPHAGRFLLVFHGAHEVSEDDAADVLQLMAGAEDREDPKPVEHYRRVREKRLDPDKGALHALRDADLLPARPEINAAGDSVADEMGALLKTEGLLGKHQRAFMIREIEERRAFVASLGLDPDIHAPILPPPEEPLPSPEDIPEYAERVKADADRWMAEQEQQWAKKKEEIHRLLVAEGLDADAILAEPDQEVCGPPLFSAEQEIRKLRALSAECVAMGCPVEELDRYAEDPERRRMLEEAELGMREGYRLMAHHQSAAPRFSGDDAARARAAVLATLESQGNLARLNMTGFDLSDMDLRGVDMSGAWLENANLARANLAGANLAEAVLARADLTEADLTGADLHKANLGLAYFVRTKAGGAILSEAVLHKAHIEDTVLSNARLDSADVMEADISATDLSRALLPELVFMKSSLENVCFAGADLKGSTFIEMDLDGVDFSGARLEGVTFLKCRGSGAVLASADLTNARFVQECSFEKADFRHAVLDTANLRGTRLAGSDFSEARLTGADFSECDLSLSRLYRASARNALFVKAHLVDAVLVYADLMNAIMQKADIRGADLRCANLYQVDLARVHADRRTNFQDANMKKVRVYPMRKPA
jgi:uncharacterized protein YjbI with pentapeptide repeats